MPLTLPDIYERLKQIDEVSLLEILNISSEDIIERFQDLIDERADQLEKELEEEFDE
jgi:hypothetical protein